MRKIWVFSYKKMKHDPISHPTQKATSNGSKTSMQNLKLGE